MTRRSTGRSERGASAVEFAIVAPLLFLLLFGIIEFARAISVYTAVSTAAREGARYGASVGLNEGGVPHYLDCDGIVEAAQARAVLTSLEPGEIDVTYDLGPEDGEDPIECGEVGQGDIQDQSRVVVAVTTDFNSPIPIISNIVGDMEVSASQARTIVTGVVGGE